MESQARKVNRQARRDGQRARWTVVFGHPLFTILEDGQSLTGALWESLKVDMSTRMGKQGGDSQGSLFCYLLMRTTCLLRHVPRHMMPLRHPYKRGKRSYEKHELLLSPSLQTGLKFPWYARQWWRWSPKTKTKEVIIFLLFFFEETKTQRVE